MAFDILTSQSDKILMLMVKFGGFISVASFFVIVGIIIHYFTSNVSTLSTGWSSLIAVLFFIGGIIISSIGIVGIYIGNIFMQVKNRPLYVIRQIINDDRK